MRILITISADLNASLYFSCLSQNAQDKLSIICMWVVHGKCGFPGVLQGLLSHLPLSSDAKDSVFTIWPEPKEIWCPEACLVQPSSVQLTLNWTQTQGSPWSKPQPLHKPHCGSQSVPAPLCLLPHSHALHPGTLCFRKTPVAIDEPEKDRLRPKTSVSVALMSVPGSLGPPSKF